MTDAEIAERVARECFGWEASESGNKWMLGNRVVHYRRQTKGSLSTPFSPRTKASDAEMVWDWLVENFKGGGNFYMTVARRLPQVHHYLGEDYDPERRGGAKLCWVGSDERDCDDIVLAEDDNWKQALCLAALEVAEKLREEENASQVDSRT